MFCSTFQMSASACFASAWTSFRCPSSISSSESQKSSRPRRPPSDRPRALRARGSGAQIAATACRRRTANVFRSTRWPTSPRHCSKSWRSARQAFQIVPGSSNGRRLPKASHLGTEINIQCRLCNIIESLEINLQVPK